MAQAASSPPGFRPFEDNPPGFRSLPKKEQAPEFSFSRLALSGQSEFFKGLSNVLGLPADAFIGAGDIVNRLIGQPETGLDAGKAFRDLFEMLGVPKIKAETATERFVGRAMEEAGASVPGLGALAKVAKSVKPLGAKAGGIFGEIVKQFQQAPGKATVVEESLALAGGTGAAISKELVPPESPFAPSGEMAGQVGGSLALSGMIRAATAIRNAAAKGITVFPNVGREQRVANVLRESMSRPEAETIPRLEIGAIRVKSAIDVTPTAAQAAEDPGLMALERGLTGTPATKGMMEDLIIRERRAVRQKLDAMTPPGATERIGQTVDEQIATARQILETQLAIRDEGLATLIENASGSRSPAQLNAFIRESLLDAETAAETQAKTLFQVIDNQGNLTAPMNTIKNEADAIFSSVRKAETGENVPDIVNLLRRQFKEGVEIPGKFADAESVSELMALRSRITDDLRKEASQLSPNRRAIQRLEQLKESVDETLLNEVPQVSEGYRQAREFFKTDVADKFRRGTGGAITRRGPLGEVSKIPESATIGQFFKQGRGASEAAKDFNLTLGQNPEARLALREAVVQDFVSVSTPPGKPFDAKTAIRWMRRHRNALDEFPEIREEITDIMGSAQSRQAVADQMQQLAKTFEKSAARFFLNEEPNKAVAAILGRKDRTNALRGLVSRLGGHQGAIQGLRRSVWEVMLEKAEIPSAFDETIGSLFVSPPKLRRFFRTNTKSFIDSKLYTKTEMVQLDEVIRVAEILNRSTGVGAAGGSDTALKTVSLFGIMGRTGGAFVGRRAGRTLIAASLGAKLGERLADFIGIDTSRELLEQALFDPKVARDLLTRVTPANERIVGQRLRAHLANLGPVGFEQSERLRNSPEIREAFDQSLSRTLLGEPPRFFPAAP